MNKLLLLVTLCITLLHLETFAYECKSGDKNFCNAIYVKNYDADTITFDLKGIHPLLGKKLPVRLYGLDTPELRTKDKCEKKKGYEAKYLVERILKRANKIDLVDCIRGKYFRLVCKIKIDGNDLSQMLLNQGYAYPYFGQTKRKINWCLTLTNNNKK